ncbi:hypothetical protein [Bacillus sp. FJAT-45350]|uniref:hypothetical protein n=1 Tax=Bacillus sp. FJAT-45350 TaxID=2011014 RepID=UPI000BB90C37|nr:hypothetical protein [Bacillus sp. FJAT-45350]
MSNDKVEQMLTQLLKIVGPMESDIRNLKMDIKDLKKDTKDHKQDMGIMQSDIQSLNNKSEQRHIEVMNKLKELEYDQDFIWEKAVRNERELGNIKRQLS